MFASARARVLRQQVYVKTNIIYINFDFNGFLPSVHIAIIRTKCLPLTLIRMTAIPDAIYGVYIAL